MILPTRQNTDRQKKPTPLSTAKSSSRKTALRRRRCFCFLVGFAVMDFAPFYKLDFHGGDGGAQTRQGGDEIGIAPLDMGNGGHGALALGG